MSAGQRVSSKFAAMHLSHAQAASNRPTLCNDCFSSLVHKMLRMLDPVAMHSEDRIVRLASRCATGKRLDASRYCASESSKSDALLGKRSFKFNARRHVERNRACSRILDSSTKAILRHSQRMERERSHAVTHRCPRNLLTSAYAATTSATTHVALSFSLRSSESFPLPNSSHHRRCVR